MVPKPEAVAYSRPNWDWAKVKMGKNKKITISAKVRRVVIFFVLDFLAQDKHLDIFFKKITIINF